MHKRNWYCQCRLTCTTADAGGISRYSVLLVGDISKSLPRNVGFGFLPLVRCRPLQLRQVSVA